MTETMNALYSYAQDRRIMKYLRDDREYYRAERCADKWEEQLREKLSPEQLSQLDALLDERLTAHAAELEASFQVGFSMALELNRQS